MSNILPVREGKELETYIELTKVVQLENLKK